MERSQERRLSLQSSCDKLTLGSLEFWLKNLISFNSPIAAVMASYTWPIRRGHSRESTEFSWWTPSTVILWRETISISKCPFWARYVVTTSHGTIVALRTRTSSPVSGVWWWSGSTSYTVISSIAFTWNRRMTAWRTAAVNHALKNVCVCLLTVFVYTAWLDGLGVWFSLWVREVPGSNPGQAQVFLRTN